MTRHASPRRPRPRTALLFALSLSAVACADGGAGCSGMTCGGTYDYPQSTLANGVVPVDDSVRFRLTQAGLDFLQERLPDLLGGLSDVLAPDPLNPAFLRMEVEDAIVLRDASPRVALGVDSDGEWSHPTTFWIRRQPILDELHFELFETEDAVGATIDGLVIGLDGRVYVTTLGGGEAACEIAGTSTVVCPPEATGGCDDVGLLTTLSFDILVTPRIGSGAECDQPALGECFKLDIGVENVVLGDFDASSIEVDATQSCNTNPGDTCDGECSDTGPFDGNGDAECSATCGAGDWLVDGAAGIAGVLEGALDQFLDDVINNGLGDALDDIDGMPASASSRLELAALVPDFAAHALDLGYVLSPTEQAFDVSCVEGTDCRLSKGMDVVTRTGVEASPDEAPGEGTPPHPCVVALDEPGFTALYGAPQFGAPLDVPLTGEFEGVPYHLGLSVARGGVNQALYAAYNTGVLCIDVDSEDIHALANGAFPLSAGTINTLSGGLLEQYTPSSSPAVVTVAPALPPVASFGAGDETQGHLLLDWQDVRVSFYVLMNERFARVFSVDVDLAVELSALYDDTTQVLELSVSSGPTLSGYEQVYSELLPDVEFAEVLEGLLGSLLDQFLGDQLAFELPLGLDGLLADATEAPIGVEVRGIETTGPSGTRERFNLYFALTDLGAAPLLRPAIGDVVASALEGDTVTLSGAYRAIDDGLEVLARVDGGAWHGPLASEGASIRFTHPRLSFPGRHDVEVRARRPGSHGAWTHAAAVVEVAGSSAGDAPPPRVRLVRDGETVRALPDDDGAVELAWATDGAWSDFGAEAARALSDLDGVRKLSVMARDEGGRLSRPFTIDLATRAWLVE